MQKPRLISDDGKRTDGRRPDELRQMKMEVGVLKNADGSALVEMGNTKVISAVFGPKEMHPKHLALPDRVAIRARYHMTPFSTDERKSPAPTRREVEILKILRETLESSVILEMFPRAEIDVFTEVIQADAGTRLASLIASSLALADAGIPIKDLIAGVAVGKADGVLVLDLNEQEDMWGEADMPVAMMPSMGQVVLLQLNGTMSSDEFRKGLEMATKGIEVIYNLEKETLKKKFAEYSEE